MKPRKLILRSDLSPGDIVMLTVAVRDLHLAHPGRFLTDVRTRCPQVWENNPWLTPLSETDPEAELIDCDYPLINDSNRLAVHCLHGFRQFLSDHLELPIPLTRLHGDIHLSPDERAWMSQVHELTGRRIPFWVVVAGGKFDVPVKWWPAERYQAVIDHFRGRIQFVQVGLKGHHHPPLDQVIDLRGQTNLRQLIRLIHHAQGVLCPVTCAMHLAAAVPTRPGQPSTRPCVVVAGGREPVQWEAYPGHRFLHTIGQLPCCERGGCWKSLVHAEPGAPEPDHRRCVDVTGNLPRCLDRIQANDVISAIEGYFQSGVAAYLTEPERAAAEAAIRKTRPTSGAALSVFTARTAAESFIRTIGPAPRWENARGLVIPAGGPRYLPCVWVCIRQLRRLGCRLPIEIWHLGPEEMDGQFARLLAPYQVACVDALAMRQRHPARILNGWELKAYALLHSRFSEVMLLDADNVPVMNPEFLFDTPEFRHAGAVFWPDYGRLAATRSIWTLCGVPHADEPEFESGQMLVRKESCWPALRLALWYNEHSDFFYQHIHGDKDTFHLAFRKLGRPYAMPDTPIHPLPGVMCQHDFQGRRVFQHRNGHKWTLAGENRHVPGFQDEEVCLGFLEELRARWSRGPGGSENSATPASGAILEAESANR